ncbi:MAG: hypothetical protein ACM3ND_16090 [Acidobacteriota bacterium]
MPADQPLALPRDLLPPAGKKQPGTWLTHAGFHALIGRIFPAALQGNFDAGEMIGSRRQHARRDNTLLAQFSSGYVE